MSWTHVEDTTPKARKDYRCLICDEIIPIGEKHTKRMGFTEDGPDSFRMHLECDEMASSWSSDEWECHGPGDVPRPSPLPTVEAEEQR